MKCQAFSLRSAVESGVAARTMAAYIDLNPVRAGMVSGPAGYRWSGYGQAVGGFLLRKPGKLGVGSKGFVNEALAAVRERFSERRKDGARRMRGYGKAASGGSGV
ncbi:hypothetical protein HZ994_14765 [Akkermansiaceae bacterium]|nr:hypothetical protein HZ994_14765 [Akkermansiaceae bacterium]